MSASKLFNRNPKHRYRIGETRNIRLLAGELIDEEGRHWDRVPGVDGYFLTLEQARPYIAKADRFIESNIGAREISRTRLDALLAESQADQYGLAAWTGFGTTWITIETHDC